MSKLFKYETFNPYVLSFISEGVKILDVGCATGLLGKNLRRKKNPKFLAGIENDLKMANAARRIYNKVVVADLEEIKKFPFGREYFDVIVCADVLEHLRHPLQVLRNLLPYLSKEGFFLISVPNIAFVSIRFSLLFGKFDYSSNGGILDETHLKFFTQKSLVGFLEKAGFEIVFIRGYNLVRPTFFFLKLLGFLFPTLFSIQFLVKVKKK